MLKLSFFCKCFAWLPRTPRSLGVALDGRAGFRYCEVDVFVYVEQAEQSEDGFLLPGRSWCRREATVVPVCVLPVGSDDVDE